MSDFTAVVQAIKNISGSDYFDVVDASVYGGSQGKGTFTDRVLYFGLIDGSYVPSPGHYVNTPGTKPTATLTVTSVPVDGSGITLFVGDLYFGFYTKQSSDTTTTILAASIANALFSAGFTITSNGAVVTIQYDTETSDYNGQQLDYAGNTIPVTSTSFSGGASPSRVWVNEVTPYWDFNYTDYPDDSILIDFLTQDTALSIRMVCTSSDPQSGSTYEAIIFFAPIDYAQEFKYVKCNEMANNRSLKDNQNFFQTLSIFQELIDVSQICINNNDQYSSQQAINQLQNIAANPNYFY